VQFGRRGELAPGAASAAAVESATGIRKRTCTWTTSTPTSGTSPRWVSPSSLHGLPLLGSCGLGLNLVGGNSPPLSDSGRFLTSLNTDRANSSLIRDSSNRGSLVC
jgi:hypothetical protein